MHFDCTRFAPAICFLAVMGGLEAQQNPGTTTVPQLVRIAGSFHAKDPQRVAGLLGATFSVYREQEGGAPLWSETQNVEVEAQGSYSVVLGSTKNEGLPAELFASGEPRWLGVRLHLPGEIEQPRVLVASVPYALKASDADTLGGRPASSYLLAEPVVSDPIRRESRWPMVMDRVPEPRANSGMANYIGMFTNSTDLVDSVMYQNNGSVGLGTINPSVQGGVGLDIESGGQTGIRLKNTAARDFLLLSTGSGLFDIFDVGAQRDRFIIDGNGNTGIGTANPGAKLEVKQSWNSYGGGIQVQRSDTANTADFYIGGDNQAYLQAGGASGGYLTVQTGGNVGIGTATPGAKLEVAGSLKLSGGGSGITFPDGTMQTTAPSGGGGAIVLPAGSAGSPSLSFANNSNTGIFSSGVQTLNFATGGTNRLTVRSDGDVDIPGSIRKGGILFLNNFGYQNTSVGLFARAGNAGCCNTALGFAALQNTTGNNNIGIGSYALNANSSGCCSTAVGNNSLLQNTGAGANDAFGDGALYSNTTGQSNVAMGRSTLGNNTTGSSNTALGNSAGHSLTTGSNNIMIGNQGVAAEDHDIRIGDVQTNTYIAGINGVTIAGGSGVLIDSSGHLGTVLSSRRFKEDIQDMGDASSNLLRLRPVTFRYKKPYTDGSKPLDYGLIAEEVAAVYPDLVVRDKDGQIETVQYHKLTPMLLNEVQKLHHELGDEHERNRKLEARVAALEALLSSNVAATATAGQ
jgi:hypothetical protein